MKYTLLVEEGEYRADTLLGLLWEIFKHRLYHFFQGDGFRD
jgi:hypothetical protein